MQIRDPVDVLVLQELTTEEHSNPVRVRHLIKRDHLDDLREGGLDEMWSLDYITQRLGELKRLELVERVPPDDSALYRITDLGHAALRHYLDTCETEISYRDLVAQADDDVDTSPIGPDEVRQECYEDAGD